MTEQPLTDLEKFRRVLITIRVAAINFGYFRGAKAMKHKSVEPEYIDIQRRIDNNFLDMGVFDFCKAFAERENQHWSKAVPADLRKDFADGLFAFVGMSEADWNSYVDEFLLYRDKFLGHLDKLREMNIPDLGPALKALQYYAQFLRSHHPLGNCVSGVEYDIDGLVAETKRVAQDYLT